MTRSRAPLVLAVVAVVALLLAGYFGWLTLFRPAARAEASTTLTNRAGGYTLTVPAGMKATRKGKATVLLDAKRSLSVTVTSTGVGPPRSTEAAVLTAMRSAYRTVSVLAVKPRTVDHRPARATYGAVVTKAGAKVQFVLVTVRGLHRNVSLSAFAPIDATSSGSTAEARFDAVVKGFRLGVQ